MTRVMAWDFANNRPSLATMAGAIDSTIEDMGLWDERERIAKRLYHAAHPTRHAVTVCK